MSDYDETDGIHKSQWTDDDKINVIIGNNPEIGTYTLNADGSIKTADQPVYWQTATPQTVNAWYSNITDQSTVTSSTVSLADQSNGLAYVLKATAPNVTFNTPAQLDFKHQLAKVRVKLEKGTYTGDLPTVSVKIKGYTSCTIDKGTITDPQNDLNNISGCVTIKGDEKETSNPITITDNAEVTIEDVNIKPSANNTAAITVRAGKHLKLIVSGKNNKLSSQNWGGIILENDASIEIVGTDKENSSLTVTAGDNNWDGASTVGIGAKQNVACDDISISNVALTVTGGSNTEQWVGAAAIGTSSEPPSGFGTKCGTITITNARVYATGGAGAAAIGIGSQAYAENTLTCGIIKIEKSELIVTIKPSKAQYYGAGIGIGVLKGATVNCGKIILDKSSGELETFTAKWAKSGTDGNSTYKIGKGYIYSEGTVTFDGVYLKGNITEIADYSDGWGSWP